MNSTIESLHAVWNTTTGQQLNLRATERIFYEVSKMDFTPDDLLCMLKHVLAYNKSHSSAPMKVQVHKLLGDLETFASILADARARERNKPPKPTPREIVLSDFRRVTPEPEDKFVPIKDVIKGLREAAL